ncbi:MAG: hypothetical protein RL653_3159 [Pseudomonadota bacterium]|jgi:hypothetical protein
MISPRILAFSALLAASAPSAALACDGKGKAAAEPPACEGGRCSAKTLLRNVDALLRRPDRCREDGPPAQGPGQKPVLLETLEGAKESTLLPDSARHEAAGGTFI